MFKRIENSHTYNREKYIHNWEYACLYVCAKRNKCFHIKKTGLGSSSEFSGSFGQLNSECGLMKEKMCACGMNPGGLLHF